MLRLLPCLLLLARVSCDVAHLDLSSTEPPPPRPYAFAYTAGRYPGHADRHHAEVSDGSGVIRGTFSYLDPRQKLRRVDYVADKEGFHPVLNDAPPEHPRDTKAVALAKERHHALYEKIAADHANNRHPVDLSSTEPPPPRPYAFAYTAGRYPGHADRHHAEVSDGSGVVRGTYSYLDLAQKLHRVDYVADKEGFHPVLNDAPPAHPRDSEAVALANERHHALYEKIAADHASNRHPDELPRQTALVPAAERHASLFRVIAEQHARIAAEREALQYEDEQAHFQNLGQLEGSH